MRLPTTHKSADPMVANLARVNARLAQNISFAAGST